MKAPVRVAITGAAGQISYSLAFRIAAGDMLGKDQPVILQLLEIPPAMDALQGVVMELNDCAFPLLAGIEATDDPNVAFKDTDYALLVGSRPRSKGMERKDLIEANAAIFSVQGKALNDHASRGVRILVSVSAPCGRQLGPPSSTRCALSSGTHSGTLTGSLATGAWPSRLRPRRRPGAPRSLVYTRLCARSLAARTPL